MPNNGRHAWREDVKSFMLIVMSGSLIAGCEKGHMPDKYYPGIDAFQTKATLNTSQMSAQLKALNDSFSTYHAQLRTVRFRYPAGWKIEAGVTTEEAGIKREQVRIHNSLGGSPLQFTLAEPGKSIYFNPGHHQPSHEIAVVTAKALSIPGWSHPTFYTEIVTQRPNGTFAVLYGLRSKHLSYDHVHTFMSTQDEIPLLISEPSQTDPYVGFLVFMNGWWGFKTKDEALAILKTPAHKTARSVIQTISFT